MYKQYKLAHFQGNMTGTWCCFWCNATNQPNKWGAMRGGTGWSCDKRVGARRQAKPTKREGCDERLRQNEWQRPGCLAEAWQEREVESPENTITNRTRGAQPEADMWRQAEAREDTEAKVLLVDPLFLCIKNTFSYFLGMMLCKQHCLSILARARRSCQNVNCLFLYERSYLLLLFEKIFILFAVLLATDLCCGSQPQMRYGSSPCYAIVE